MSAIALTLGVSGLTLISTANAATAAPHLDGPPSVQVGWTDSATPKKAYPVDSTTDVPLGTWQDDKGKSHTSRVYATFDLSAYEGKKIYGGKVFLEERSVADCSKRAVEIWRTKPVTTTPTWNRAPAPLAKLGEVLTPVQFCPGASITFDVGAAVQDAVAHRQRHITFEIRVPEQYESDASYGRRLHPYRSVDLNVEFNSVPQIDTAHLYNGGLPCTQLAPYPRIGGFASILEAVGSDADEYDERAVETEVAIWPKANPDARQVFTGEHGLTGRANRVNLPEGTLVDGTTYVWQARATDGADYSPWSKKCFFTHDRTAPVEPTITSANYPQDSTGEAAPTGVSPVFTFSGNGDKDVAGFEYSWRSLGGHGCSASGAYGQLECTHPLDQPGSVRANTPGGSATVTIDLIGSGPQRLSVRTIDLAGNVSETVEYRTLVPRVEPEVRVENGTPEWGQEVLLKFVPAPGVTGVRDYEITLDGGTPETRDAQEDGTAFFSFFATNPNGHHLKVRSRSDNGFVSPEANWSTSFYPGPGVKSDVYSSPDGSAVGGVGIEGTFTFSPPPGWTDTTAYQYSFNGAEPTEVAADANGRATITWTPTAIGYVDLTVYAVRADGTVSDYPNWYSFEVAASAS
ncbi:hypothetical protein O7614_32160 [Micromonospora sp. WMMD961]|uniref:hypothetical protein n=1 Tax=Micromonospora sp. WMMD961 TaxID=3016100 RepID=UPI002417610F|nr:hypothetical protein [Micromonospora sp. WMMD961]MDG4778045.1 hypothetical protein [Micromonospora sp. WMMD961]MDG4778057.1 hypothetical protein [Micromonospora sp. WMMD961]MDG4784318.1 hypothetical protein [Micromonospora sp. WMMD961]